MEAQVDWVGGGRGAGVRQVVQRGAATVQQSTLPTAPKLTPQTLLQPLSPALQALAGVSLPKSCGWGGGWGGLQKPGISTELWFWDLRIRVYWFEVIGPGLAA